MSAGSDDEVGCNGAKEDCTNIEADFDGIHAGYDDEGGCNRTEAGSDRSRAGQLTKFTVPSRLLFQQKTPPLQ
jgi:hypothetical protein